MPSSDKRIIVSVGTGRYLPYLKRLRRSLEKFWSGPTLIFEDFPPGSPTHQKSHYAFKIYAVKAAIERGFTSILYLDSPAIAVRPVAPIFDHISEYGYLLVADGHELKTWSADALLQWIGLDRKTVTGTLAGGGFVGFDLERTNGKLLWETWQGALERGLNQVWWVQGGEAERPNRARSISQEGVLLSDDPDVLGHLGEESVFGAMVEKHGLQYRGMSNGWYGHSPEGCTFYGPGYDGKDV